MSNIYYSPQEFNVTILGEIEFSDGYYQFNTRVFWKGKDGTIYTYRDSGCSCPTPFEDVSSLDDLTIVNSDDIDWLIGEVRSDVYGYSCTSRADAIQLIHNIFRGKEN